jgi:predicted HD phosphohydrolase
MNARASFTDMKNSTQQDWEIIASDFLPYNRKLPDRIMAHLRLLEGDYGGFPVDRYTHSLQTATRALRAGRDEEYVVSALLHDIGDSLGTFNHPDIATAILKPFVSEANLWMVQHHGIFQGYNFFHHLGMDRNMRDQYSGHPHYDYTAEFIELYDSPAFDQHGETLPLSEFEPMLRRLTAKPRNMGTSARAKMMMGEQSGG